MDTSPDIPTEPGVGAPDARESVRNVLSLERRLPLMISGLLAVTLIAFGFLAFTELRQSSLQAATVQVRTLFSSTRDNAVRSVAQRVAALEQSASLPEVSRAATERASPLLVDGAVAALRTRISPSDTVSLAGELFIDAGGQRHVVTAADLAEQDLAALDSTVSEVARSDSTVFSAMYVTDSIMRYWLVTPVRGANGARGFLAARRQLSGSASIEQQLKDLTGQDLSVYFASVNAPLWTGIRGVPIPAKFDISAVPDTFRVVTAEGETLIGMKSPIRGIPLALVMSINESSISARADTFLRRMLVVGALLLLISILGASLVSRRVTGPLKSLTVAARHIERGNYEVREPVRTDDELGELAQAFNHMAQRIGESHALLALRIHESEALALQLHRASAAKSEFLAMMSHELRTPLSAIAGYAEILQLGMRGALNEAQGKDLARIQANQVHLLRIINDILDLAQVESGQMQIRSAPVAMSDVVNAVEPIVLPLVAGRDLNYSVHPDVRTLVVTAERDRLTQVLVNLVANAIRFTPAGGNISISADAEGADGRVRIHVTDTGIGIAPEKHEAIFQPFVQVEGGASRPAEGTGLGLAISRRLVEAMGGTLTVSSTLGGGSRFTIDLQPAESAHVSAAHAEHPPHAARTGIVGTPERRYGTAALST